MNRDFNFGAGPSMLPLPVLEKVQKELLCYPGEKCSVLEMSHRAPAFMEIISKAEADLRTLLAVPDSYAVLFLQGGASMQFSMIPMNLMPRGGTAAYADTGVFAKKAAEEASRWGDAVIVASSADKSYSYIPSITQQSIPKDAAYLHICGNNTIFGTQFNTLPAVDLPLVVDLSSSLMGQLYNVEDCGLIYAGTQKNMGIAGLTIVIIRRDLLKELPEEIPSMLNYKLLAEHGSMYNTPPCFSIYLSGLVFEYTLAQGGVAEMERRNKEKAALLYDVLDASKFYTHKVRAQDRSIMNVTFFLPDEAFTAAFLKGAQQKGLSGLKGHRDAGGIRASLYNAMTYEGVSALADYMKAFETENR